MLPQHYNKAPFAANVDKIYFVERSSNHPLSARIVFGSDCYAEVNLPLDELIVLLNNAAQED
jgi:hypothetical protein